VKIQFFHSSGGGPGIFMRRLRHYLVEHYNVQVTDQKPDIYLSAVWRGHPPKGARIIHRADNCYFNTLQHNRSQSNKAIKSAIMKADAVVFQSKFSYKICKGVLGIKPNRYRIIYNAIDQQKCLNTKPIQIPYEKKLIACAKWRPIKRPRAIVKAFVRADIPNSVLFMMGSPINKKLAKIHKNVKWIGKISTSETYRYYKACDAMIHIARLDACPNTVIEALSFGKPVIGNNAGGTPELVGNDGIIANIDPDDDYKPFPMKNPEDIRTKKVAKAIRKCVEQSWSIYRPEFDMSHCAKQYHDLFLEILER